MNYKKLTLKGTLADIIADVKGITWNDELVYPNYPSDYEKIIDGERFIITEPRQEILTQGEYNDQGEEITPPVMGDYVAHLVLPSSYDTSGLNTIV